MNFYFVQNCESSANIMWEFSNSGWKQTLTRMGVAQTFASDLSVLQVGLRCSSPGKTALQTAQILVENLHAPHKFVEGLRDYSVVSSKEPPTREVENFTSKRWRTGSSSKNSPARCPGAKVLLKFEVDSFLLLRGWRNKVEIQNGIIGAALRGLYLAILRFLYKNVNFAFAFLNGFPNCSDVLAETQPGGLEWFSLNSKLLVREIF